MNEKILVYFKEGQQREEKGLRKIEYGMRTFQKRDRGR